jgi:chemosensory pili system protein ChpA (sensor histidine kinase/response regulator)
MLQVDSVLGQEEVVVKSLGDLLTGHPVLAGVTIRGTGELSLILDIPGVVEAHAGRTVSGGMPKITSALERAPKGREAARMPAAQRKLRVLFVDDSLSVRKIAEKELNNLGTDVTTAVDGLDAMAKLREGNFDIIFTDLEMPRMHGYDLIRELRFLPAYQDLPIIVVSSRSGQKHQDQARALGCTDYLTKPFNARQLEGALDKYAHKKKALAPAHDDSSAASQSQDQSGGDSQ